MEDSLNRNYINISNKKFKPAVYNEPDSPVFSYKPTTGFWLSLESKNKKYYSQWDEEYRDTLIPDENNNLHATVVRFKPSTYFLSPSQDKTILEGFKKFTDSKKLNIEQKRKLLVELIRTHLDKPEVENVICQIDILEDLMALEEVFGGYTHGEEYPDEVYKNLRMNVKNGVRQAFSGIEVTGFALGLDEDIPEEGIDETQAYWNFMNPKYDETIGYFEMPSVAVFDTSCLDVVKEIVYPKGERDFDDENR